MKKKTRKLIESVKSLIENYYPFLDENEQNEIFENFVYRSLLNEIIDLTKRSQVPSSKSVPYFTDRQYRINLEKRPTTPNRQPSILSNDPMEVATAIGLKANMDPSKVLLILQNPKAANPADLSNVQNAIRSK